MCRRIVFLLLLTLLGCGYQVPGRGGTLPEGVDTLALQLLTNRTLKPGLENGVTDAIADALSRHPAVRLIADRGQAQAVAEGSILSYATTAIAYDQNDVISTYRARMTLEISLRHSADGRLLWRDRLAWQETYPAVADKALQNDLQDEAIREINRRLAEELLFRLLAGF